MFLGLYHANFVLIDFYVKDAIFQRNTFLSIRSLIKKHKFNLKTELIMKELDSLTEIQKSFVAWSDEQPVNKHVSGKLLTSILSFAIKYPYIYVLAGIVIMVIGVQLDSSFIYNIGMYVVVLRYLISITGIISIPIIGLLRPPFEGSLLELKKAMIEISTLFVCNDFLKIHFIFKEKGEEIRKVERKVTAIAIIFLALFAWDWLPGVDLSEISFDLTLFWSNKAFFILAILLELSAFVVSYMFLPKLQRLVDLHLGMIENNKGIVRDIVSG